jgi:hypothetical protein
MSKDAEYKYAIFLILVSIGSGMKKYDSIPIEALPKFPYKNMLVANVEIYSTLYITILGTRKRLRIIILFTYKILRNST